MTCINHVLISNPRCLACTVTKQSEHARRGAIQNQSRSEAMAMQHSAELDALEQRRQRDHAQLSQQQEEHASATRAFERTMWESNTREGEYFKEWRQWASPWVSLASQREAEWDSTSRAIVDQMIADEPHTKSAAAHHTKAVAAGVGAVVSFVLALATDGGNGIVSLLGLLGILAVYVLVPTGLVFWFRSSRGNRRARTELQAIRDIRFPSWSCSAQVFNDLSISHFINITRSKMNWHAHEANVYALEKEFAFACATANLDDLEHKNPSLPEPLAELARQYRSDDRFRDFEPAN